MGARETVQWVRSLLGKHEDFSSNPQSPLKKILKAVELVTSALGVDNRWLPGTQWSPV